MREVVVVSALRTAIGTFGGSLKDTPPSQMATVVVKKAIEQAGIQAQEVDQVVMGHVINTEPKDLYLSRFSAIQAGCDHRVTAFNVNRLCGSGLQAVVCAAQSIQLGDTQIAVAGGAENMTRSPFINAAQRMGQRMGDVQLVDMMIGALHDPFENIHMGVTAENIAKKWGITRAEQDALALQSHQRAQHAIAQGYFKDQIVPLTLKSRKGPLEWASDEHWRMDAKAEDFSQLKPVFIKDNGTVTAGNASGINDASAALVLMDSEVAHAKGRRPMARLVSYAHAGVEAAYMGIGPVPATQAALKKAGLSVQDLDVIEANEAFAVQACAVIKDLGLDPAKVNPNGSGISLGHPIGATGALITVKALHELQRIQGRYALVTMCIGGGQGIAAIFERL
jgi:acetyl-CoA C-acetyltransferase